MQNDIDTQDAAAAAEDQWDSGDRRVKRTERFTDTYGHTEEGKEAVTAVLAADRDQAPALAKAFDVGACS